MKIKDAIRAARFRKTKIKSYKLNMYQQDAKSLVHWVFVDPKSIFEQVKILIKILLANDWELDHD